MRKICQIADYLDFGMSRNCKIVVNEDTADAIDRRAEGFANE